MKRLVLFAIQFVAVGIAVLLFAELYVRGTGIQAPRYTYMDQDMGIAFRPETPYLKYTEGFSFGRFNEDGLRGPMPRGEGRKRIVLMGDSYTAGFQVWERSHFQALLVEGLGGAYDCWNLSMEGFDFGQMYARYQEKYAGIQPDLTVFLLKPDDFAFSRVPMNPFLRVEGDSLIVDKSFQGKGDFQQRYQRNDHFLYNSSLLQLLGNANILRQNGKLGAILFDKLATLWQAGKAKPHAESGPKLPRSIWANDADSLKLDLALRQLAQQRVVLVTFRSLLPEDQARIETYGVPVYDMAAYLDAEGGNELRSWKATQRVGHYNYEGHQAIADFLLTHIEWP